ncbi:MAG: helix-hairpin-helix domain-containing protein, partial [Candidatus Woesearchaeota archaeon]
LSLIATKICDSEEKLNTFFKKTFWAHQYGDMSQIRSIVQKVIHMLKEYDFITDSTHTEPEKKSQDFLSAAELSEKNARPLKVTTLGKRVSQLYLDPYSAHFIITGLQKKTTIFGIFQLLCATLELRPLLTVKSKEIDDIHQLLFTHEDELTKSVPGIYDHEYDDFFQTLKTAKYFEDWIMEISEKDLFEKYDIRPGEISAKNAIMDWLLYCCIELSKCVKIQNLQLIKEIRARLPYGVKEDVLPLLQLKNVGKVRARKLIEQNVKTLKDIKNMSVAQLEKIVGEGIAISLKNQLGENHQKIPKKEKKVHQQQGLEDFFG